MTLREWKRRLSGDQGVGDGVEAFGDKVGGKVVGFDVGARDGAVAVGDDFPGVGGFVGEPPAAADFASEADEAFGVFAGVFFYSQVGVGE